LTVFDAIRAAAAAVAARARFVHIDDERLRVLAEGLLPELAALADDDPAHVRLASEADTLAFVVTLDAVNFGSGWFPVLNKPEGSGYRTIATALRRHFESHGAMPASQLARITAVECAHLFGQEADDPQVGELMALFARSLGDLGDFVERRFGGSFEELVDSAGGRAEALVMLLAEMPLYRDVSTYAELEVPFYKRAQITVADLALAFEGSGPGHFADLDQLTIFADNLVPHVLRCEGVLRYEPSLLRRIEAAERLPPGCPEEVEIRAVAVHAVERMAGHLARSGRASVLACDLDRVLWTRGQSPSIKARNRHRTRSVFY
jgi:hypothetical protein